MNDAFANILTEAGKIAQDSRKDLQFHLKRDRSIVTNGDQSVEAFLRDSLAPLEPDASFWGEEGPYEEPKEEGFWLVDPIDGTSNYAYNGPLWGVSVAFYKQGNLRYGGIYLPDLNELVIAEEKLGAKRNGKPIPKMVSGEIKDYELVACTESIIRKVSIDQFPGKPRLSGAFVTNAMFTIFGYHRALFASREKLYDIAASIVIAREVGADVRYLNGEPFLEKDLLADKPVNKLWGILPPDSQLHINLEILATGS